MNRPIWLSGWASQGLRLALTVSLLVLPCVGRSAEPVSAGAQSATDRPWSKCAEDEGYVHARTRDLVVNSAKCGGQHEIWLSKSSMSAAPSAVRGLPASEVIDHLVVRELREGEKFSSGPYCTSRGIEIQWSAIYRLGKNNRIPRSGAVREAWVVDVPRGRLGKAPAELIKTAICRSSDSE